MKKWCLTLVIFIAFSDIISAQQKPKEDTSKHKMLDQVIINSARRLNHPGFLPDIEGTIIFSGKKSNQIYFDEGTANLAGNVARTAFSTVPGLTIWDMSGSGTQINIGTRGTDPHRSIEMNMRQNGYNINSSVFGYPEAHYTPPMQGVERVELVRGSAALQFGPQYGGMFNYVMKEGDTSVPLSIKSEQTLGSFNFFNSFNAVGGSKGRWNYYAYYDNRSGNGWRKAAAFSYHGYYANISYLFSKYTRISFQFSRMDYREQIAGGLTDSQFKENDRQSLRKRNFFSPIINIPAIKLNAVLSSQTHLTVTAHYLGGERSSVQFLNPPNIADTINSSLMSFNPRQVDRDHYSSITVEARILHHFKVGSLHSNLSGGVRLFNDLTKRRQKGVGTTGFDFDLSLTKPYGIDLNLYTKNLALFAENQLLLSDKFSITPGVRYEYIYTKMKGVINNATDHVEYRNTRNLPLFGVGLQYDVYKNAQLYGNISQAYRPFLYSNVTPADRIDIIDPDLKDSKGYDADFGFRGRVMDILNFDVNGFLMYYGNRVGQLTLQNASSQNYLYTTNVGDARSVGVEAYISFSFAKLVLPGIQDHFYRLKLFNSFSFTHARYINGEINKNGTNVSLKNNRLENVPEITNRTGLIWQQKTMVAQLLYTYVGKSYSDANNTIFNPSGATGIVPSYQLIDLSINWRFLKHYALSAGINNALNKKYFTRRINMYPGPGILPADGRSYYVSVGCSF